MKFKGFVVAVLFLLCCSQAGAQSGRRLPRSAPPNSTAAENATGEVEKRPRVLASNVKLLIAREPTSKHYLSEDSIAASFVKRLNEYGNLRGTWIGDLKRDQAMKRAQSETEAFVVLLQFDIDSFQEGKIILNSPDLQVKYFVLAPQTGQQKLKGKVYYQAIGGPKLRKDNWPTGPAIKITTEGTGIEAAERVYQWLASVVGIKRNQ